MSIKSALLSIVLLCVVSPAALACTCRQEDVATAKREADVVFAGKVEEVIVVDEGTQWEPRVVVKFSVARAWKGDVGKTFTMHTSFEASSCEGFPRELLEPGNTLLVYGYAHKASGWKQNRLVGASNAASMTVRRDEAPGTRQDLLRAVPGKATIYSTNICSRTTPIEYAVEDFDGLGPYQEFATLDVLPDAALVESQKRIPNGLPDECGELADARAWARVAEPRNMAGLVDVLEQGPMYTGVMKTAMPKFRDFFVADRDDRVGMCRVSVDDKVVCGEASVIFVRKDSVWKTTDGRVSNYCKAP